MIEVLWNIETPAGDHAAEIETAMRAALAAETRSGDVCVQIVDPDTIRCMNRDFRHVDAVTDVLTFPAQDGEALFAPPDGYLGDVAICYQRAAEQAADYGHSLRRELCFLAVHGALHLCGYDHMTPGDEARMCERQEEILRKMKVER